MKIDEFIEWYDFEDSFVLLEGKREVMADDIRKLFELGRLLAEKSVWIKFRSGNAAGADQYFTEGVASVDKSRLQLITPYRKHRLKTSDVYDTISLDDIDIAKENNIINHSKMYKPTERLIDKFTAGDINRNTIKAAYIIRDTVKALGTNAIKPAVFGIFYDNNAKPRTGGTGHTMDVCERNGIPIIDQRVWFNWLEEC